MDKEYGAKRQRPRSALFLTELILAILIFALCMGICGSVFVRAFEATSNSNNLNQAVLRAQNAVEAFQAQEDMAALAESLGGYLNGGEEITVYYDRNWNVVNEAAAVAFLLRMDVLAEGALKEAAVTVSGRKDIYHLASAKNWELNTGLVTGRD